MKKYRDQFWSPDRAEGETNDCAVIALAIAGRMTYREAHLACAATGRKLNRGMRTLNILQSFDLSGLEVYDIPKLWQPNGRAYTPITIGKRLFTGYYLVVTEEHVFAVVNGVVEDWCHTKRFHITAAYKVIKPR